MATYTTDLRTSVLFVLVSTSLAFTTLNPSQQYWWHNACGNRKTRHLLHKRGSEPKIAMNSSINHYERDVEPYLNELKLVKDQVNLSWLPNKPRCNNHKVLNRQLSQYAAVIDKLQRTKITTEDSEFDLKRRKDILDSTKHSIKNLLCEVQYKLLHRMKGAEKLQTFSLKELKVDKLTIKPGTTPAILQDYAVLRSYGRFITKCKNTDGRLRKQKGTQKKGTQLKGSQQKGAQQKDTHQKGSQLKGPQENTIQQEAIQGKTIQEKAIQEKTNQEKNLQEKATQEKATHQKDTTPKSKNPKRHQKKKKQK